MYFTIFDIVPFTHFCSINFISFSIHVESILYSRSQVVIQIFNRRIYRFWVYYVVFRELTIYFNYISWVLFEVFYKSCIGDIYWKATLTYRDFRIWKIFDWNLIQIFHLSNYLLWILCVIASINSNLIFLFSFSRSFVSRIELN